MILIKSKPFEKTTDHVIEWLSCFQADFVRIDNGNPIVRIVMKMEDDQTGEPLIELHFAKGQKISSTDLTAFWSRRGRFEIQPFRERFEALKKVGTVRNTLIEELQSEWEVLENFISHSLADQKFSLNDASKEDFNKLEVLSLAAKCGLKIPPTLAATSKSAILNTGEELITKAFSEAVSMEIGDEEIYALTTRITKEKAGKLGEDFFPSYFQKGIEKQYELRVFYLDGSFHAMAIFSQMDEQTKDDFRAYNRSRPNRNVPYQLPEDICTSLQQLMNRLNLTCCSIDLIVDNQDDFYFLEVNPVGQFGMVSLPCNYYLEKKVAAYLSTKKDTSL